jgi:uncharacterized protein YndB with AHSA1/START domain
METISVERSIWINAPRERVWQAITQDEQIRHWWGQDDWSIPSVEVGAVIQFGTGDDRMNATIAVVDAPNEFAIEWPPQPQYHAIAIITRYVLTEENGGTRVTVTESGFEALPDDIRQKRFDQTAEGYSIVLADLKAFIEGTPLPNVD